MHIIVERMIPFPEDDARIQGLKVRAETYACEKNIGDNIYTYAYVVSVRVYIFCTEYCSFLLYKRFSGIIFFHEILTALCLFSIVYFFFFLSLSFLLFFFSFQIQTLRLYDYQSYLRELCVLSSRNTIASYIDHRVLST